MYIYDGAWDPDTANTACTANNPGTQPDIMIHILDCLQAVNPYIPLYNQAHVRGMLQLFAFSLQSLQVWMVGSITFQQQMRLLLSFLGIMLNMQLLDDLIVQLCLHNDQNGPKYQCIWETNFNYTPLMYVLLASVSSWRTWMGPWHAAELFRWTRG